MSNAKQVFKITQRQIAYRAGVRIYTVCRHLQGVKLRNPAQAIAIENAIDEITTELTADLKRFVTERSK